PAAGGPTPEVLRRHLRGRLPAVMVPSDFVLLEELPRTPNRKVDRRALPAPESSRRQVDTELVPPRTRAERRVAEIWQEVLGLETIGTRDNFFDLGGHSLQLVQVHRRLERDFARTLSILDLFHHPTIRAQAAFLSAATPDEDALEGVRTRARHQVDAIRQRRRRMRRIKSR
ncbi:MAG: non-ribosomal peptide synthetase, partial [bacterium]|nr:non-ribosomal peptide synthetase [bacterium]